MKDDAKSDKEGNISIGLTVLEKQIIAAECVLEKLGDRLRDVLINSTNPLDEEKPEEKKDQCLIANEINHLTTRVIMIKRSLTDLIERVDI